MALVAAAALVAGVAGGGASGAARLDPGVTATSIKIGGTFPLTGLQAVTAPLAQAAAAYFDYVNDHGGVNSRKIEYELLDDGYDVSQTVLKTQKLVEQDRVFADYGSFGAQNNLAIRDYLNQRKVPQVLVASPANFWGYQYKKYPWTIGFTPDAGGEGRIYGEYILNHMRDAKVGVLYQNNPAGRDYLAGLRAGLGVGNKKAIVGTQTYDATQPDVSQQVLALKGSGADVFFAAGAPPQPARSLVVATQVGWQRRLTIVSWIGSSASSMKAAVSSGANIAGDIRATWGVDPTTPSEANLPGIMRGKQILARYGTSLDATNTIPFVGLASAWTMIYALQHAGNPPTRAGLMAAFHSLDPKKAKNPFLYPGIGLHTSNTDNFPLEQLILVKWVGGSTGYWQPFGKIYDHAR